jgi:hypothetical protein
MKRFPAYERLAFELVVVALAVVLNLGDGLRQAVANMRDDPRVARPPSLQVAENPTQATMSPRARIR